MGLAALFALLGGITLVYEVWWTRWLALLVGRTTCRRASADRAPGPAASM